MAAGMFPDSFSRHLSTERQGQRDLAHMAHETAASQKPGDCTVWSAEHTLEKSITSLETEQQYKPKRQSLL